MSLKGPIILIDDDYEDREIILSIFSELLVKNEVFAFNGAKEAFEFVTNSNRVPLCIITDIHMPMMNGFQFREAINSHADIEIKSIPLIFLTTGATKDLIKEAYSIPARALRKTCKL